MVTIKQLNDLNTAFWPKLYGLLYILRVEIQRYVDNDGHNCPKVTMKVLAAQTVLVNNWLRSND